LSRYKGPHHQYNILLKPVGRATEKYKVVLNVINYERNNVNTKNYKTHFKSVLTFNAETWAHTKRKKSET
jgi:hypothetical protein